MLNIFRHFKEDKSGATAIEYGLIAALIAIGVILGATTLGQKIEEGYSNLGQSLVDKSKADSYGKQ